MKWDEEDFLKRYRGMERFVTNEREYYSLFLELMQNNDLLGQIKFANDVLGVPPLKSFVLYHRKFSGTNLFDKKMDALPKRGLGACFGYLYKFIYGGYESDTCWFDDEKTEIKTASYFIKKGDNNK